MAFPREYEPKYVGTFSDSFRKHAADLTTTVLDRLTKDGEVTEYGKVVYLQSPVTNRLYEIVDMRTRLLNEKEVQEPVNGIFVTGIQLNGSNRPRELKPTSMLTDPNDAQNNVQLRLHFGGIPGDALSRLRRDLKGAVSVDLETFRAEMHEANPRLKLYHPPQPQHA